MKPLALVLIVAVSSGCTTRRQSLIAMGVGAGMVGVGALSLHSIRGDEEVPPVVAYGTLGLLVGGAVLFLVSGLSALDSTEPDIAPRVKYDVAGYDACMRRRRDVLIAAQAVRDPDARAQRILAAPGCGIAPTAAERAAQRDSVRERAWVITKAIESAARTGDCAAVVRADAEVAALDPDFHETVFRRDAAIAQCLAR